MMVPGGQAELVQTWRLRRQREYVIYTKHKGFVRLAIQSGASLVPVVVLGEVDSLYNLIDLPLLQAWTYKKLGFPVPYLVVGRWGLSPLPRATGLKFVVGEPIAPPAYTPGAQVPQEQVDALHQQFYKATVALFLKHKDTFPGYEDVKLVVE
jgi:2-acylglycerol O-acyltransferase 2